MVAIYGIVDKRTQEIRYVGRAKNPAERFRRHLTAADRGQKQYVYDWIRSLGRENVSLILLELDPHDPHEAERAWIATLRRYGCRLTNLTDGGPNRVGVGRAPGFKHSDETKRKISEANRGRKRSDEARAKMSRTRKGRSHSPEHIAARAEAHRGMKRSATCRAAISRAQRERFTDPAAREKVRQGVLRYYQQQREENARSSS